MEGTIRDFIVANGLSNVEKALCRSLHVPTTISLDTRHIFIEEDVIDSIDRILDDRECTSENAFEYFKSLVDLHEAYNSFEGKISHL